MKFTSLCLLISLSALLAVSAPGSPAPKETKTPEQLAVLRVDLRLNGIQTAQMVEHYTKLAARELSLQDNVRACIKSGDERLPQYQQAFEEVRNDLKAAKEKLVKLEVERAKLIKSLGLKSGEDGSVDSSRRNLPGLEKILERLDGMEKRLEKLERQK